MNETTETPIEYKKFNSITEIVEDKYFRNFVAEVIDEIRMERNKRPAAKPGYKYKRDWYDRMTEQGCFNSSFFIEHAAPVWAKISNLSGEFCKIVKLVINEAFRRTVAEYNKMLAEQVEGKK